MKKRFLSSMVMVIALAFVVPLFLPGCGLGSSEEECFEQVGIPYSGAADKKEKADAFCRSKGFERATTIDGNGVKILTICCKKD